MRTFGLILGIIIAVICTFLIIKNVVEIIKAIKTKKGGNK